MGVQPKCNAQGASENTPDDKPGDPKISLEDFNWLPFKKMFVLHFEEIILNFQSQATLQTGIRNKKKHVAFLKVSEC